MENRVGESETDGSYCVMLVKFMHLAAATFILILQRVFPVKLVRFATRARKNNAVVFGEIVMKCKEWFPGKTFIKSAECMVLCENYNVTMGYCAFQKCVYDKDFRRRKMICLH